MVGPGEVNGELEGETKEECQKYGEVQKVVIFEVHFKVKTLLIYLNFKFLLNFRFQIRHPKSQSEFLLSLKPFQPLLKP